MHTTGSTLPRIAHAVILAIGSPYHRSQLTYSRPRALLPALGKPLVARAMDRLYRATDIRHYTVVVGEDEGAIPAYLQNHWTPGIQVDFTLHAANDPLLDTLRKLALTQPRPFLLAGYNTFMHSNFPQQLIEHYEGLGEYLILSGTGMSLSHSDHHDYVIADQQRVTTITSEQSTDTAPVILTNLAVCGQPFVDYLATQRKKRTDMLPHRELQTLLRAYVNMGGETRLVPTSWALQVDHDYDLLTLTKYLLDEDQDSHILSELPASVRIIPPVRIDPSVSVGHGATIGPYVYLESGCHVGRGATVQNAVVLQKAAVAANTVVSNVILATRASLHV
jgi:NDP-sugar pyrophosphorylase family protein